MRHCPQAAYDRAMDAWLTAARDAVAETAGVPPEELELDDEAEQTLLDVARIAAHESGERTNAPLLCYLLGRAEGKASLDELAAAVRRTG
jgi:truncated hemoglobin YjbI